MVIINKENDLIKIDNLMSQSRMVVLKYTYLYVHVLHALQCRPIHINIGKWISHTRAA
jgi:hypothetical protein